MEAHFSARTTEMVMWPRRLWAPASKSQALASGSRGRAQGREKGLFVFIAAAGRAAALHRQVSLRAARRRQAHWLRPSDCGGEPSCGGSWSLGDGGPWPFTPRLSPEGPRVPKAPPTASPIHGIPRPPSSSAPSSPRIVSPLLPGLPPHSTILLPGSQGPPPPAPSTTPLPLRPPVLPTVRLLLPLPIHRPPSPGRSALEGGPGGRRGAPARWVEPAAGRGGRGPCGCCPGRGGRTTCADESRCLSPPARPLSPAPLTPSYQDCPSLYDSCGIEKVIRSRTTSTTTPPSAPPEKTS